MNTSPNSQWYYAVDGQQHGPLSFADLQQEAKTLSEGALAWTEGMTNWLPLKEIPGLTGQYEGSHEEETGESQYPLGVPNHIPQALQDGLEIPPEPIPLSVGFCIQQAWKHTLQNFWMVVFVGLVALLINGGLGAILDRLGEVIQGPELYERVRNLAGDSAADPVELMEARLAVMQTPFGIVALVAKQIVGSFLALGIAAFGFKLLSGTPAHVEALFSQGKKLWRGFLGTLLWTLIVMAGLVLFIVPGVYFGNRFAFFLEAIVEKDLGVIDAFRYSFKLTEGNIYPMIGLFLMNLLIVFAGALTCFIGLFWAIPVVTLARLIAYRYLHAAHQGIVVRN